MIPHTISDRSVTFFAGRFYTVGEDHPHFGTIRDHLVAETSSAEDLAKLADVKHAVEDATCGKVVLTEDVLLVDGEAMPAAWHVKAVADPQATRVLLMKAGDTIRVEGDEEAPDGVYTVSAVDNDDVEKRIYIETEDGFFGFVANSAVKEIING